MKSSLWRSLRFRLAATAGVGGIVGLLTVGLFLSIAFQRSAEADFDARLRVILRALLTYAEVDPDAGALVLGYDGDETRFEQSYQGWYWQVGPVAAAANEDSPLIQRSKSLEDWSLSAERPEELGEQIAGINYGPVGQKLRYVSALYSLPPTDEEFLFVVAGNYSEVTDRVVGFRMQLLQSLAIMLVVLGGVAVTQVLIGTSPMRRMRKALAEVRNGKKAKLDGEYLNEVQPLINELNALLDHNAEVVERARTQVGNLAHALKTPLSVLKNASEDKNDPQSELVSREAAMMRTQIDHYLARARAAASVNVIGVRSNVSERIAPLMRTMSAIYKDRKLKLELDCSEGLVFKGEAHDLDEMLGNLIDNACIWANSCVLVSGRQASADQIEITIDDDGPGLSEEERDAVVRRGKRLDESKPGSGLGLSIVNDIAQLYAGSLVLSESPNGGLRATLILPAFQAQN